MTGANRYIGFYRRDTAGSSASYTPTNAISLSTTYVITCKYSGTQVSLYTDGVQNGVTTAVNVGACTLDLLALGQYYVPGAGSSSAFVDGRMPEILIYNSALSDSDRSAVESYLISKWKTTPISVSTSFGTFQEFEPTDISGCLSWHRADRGVTHSADLVSQVDDLSGNNNHATQSSGANKPTLVRNVVNGLPALSFDGSASYLSFNTLAASLTGSDVAFSVVAVVKNFPVNVNSNTLFSVGRSSSGNPFHIMETDGGTTFTYSRRRDDAASLVSLSTVSNDTSVNVISTVFTGTTASAWKNGTNQFSGTAQNVGTMTVDQATIGALNRTSVSNYWTGYICELVIYNSALTDGARMAVEYYLTKKWLTTTPTLIGTDTEDYLSTFTESSGFRHFWLQLMAPEGSVYTHSKISFGKAFDFGRDPIFGRNCERRFLRKGDRKPGYVFDLSWVDITDAKRQEFESQILKYRDFMHVGVHVSGYTDPLFEHTAIPCRIVNYTGEQVKANSNNIDLQLEEVW
jgi:hypothetical protein